MRRISRQHVLMLTGTPVQNNLRELYALLTFMYPDLFTDPTLFETGFNLARNQVDDSKLEQAHYVSVGESVGTSVWGWEECGNRKGVKCVRHNVAHVQAHFLSAAQGEAGI